MTCFPSSSRALLAALILLAAGTAANAQTTISTTDVPRTISYQGLLTSTDGIPFSDGQYQVTVTLYGNEQGTGPIWQENYTTQVAGGVFNIVLGSGGKALPPAEMMNRPLWIGTSVNGAEMRPLTPLTASPYAFNVPDKAITGSKIADGAITAEKIDADYIGAIQVDGRQISSKGTVLNLVGTPAIPLNYDEETRSLTIGRTEARSGDAEKGAKVQGTTSDYWTMQGDGGDYITGPATLPAPGDWIGTTNAVQFDIRTFSTPAMRYHTSAAGSDPNVEGGQGSTVAAASVGSTIAGGGANNIVGNYDAIGGGQMNNIADGNYNVIGGGQNNGISTGGAPVDWSGIGSGQSNNVDAPHSFIGGGVGNAISGGPMSAIGGGGNNTITAPEATIAGGHVNSINAYAGAITGGHDNMILLGGEASHIGGGRNNVIDALIGAIGGGRTNRINPGGDQSFIGGGENNAVNGPHSTIAGGLSNNIAGVPMSAIGGGAGHMITAPEATIAGGHNNRVDAYVGAITGGHDNVIAPGGNAGFIGGGRNNTVDAPTGAVGGGENNRINPGGDHAFIGGGQDNSVDGPHSTIAGGMINNIAGVPMSTIGGGAGHVITAPEATIAGGHNNRIDAYVGAITGGHDNVIGPNGEAGFIGGGRNNTVDARLAAIGGGQENLALGTHTAIPGGDLLRTDPSYAQIVMGFSNAPRGVAVGLRPGAAVIAGTDGPLLMVGNGVAGGTPSNAFEVSYNGHSTVFDINGSGTGRSAFKGATYADNVVYGWGEVDPGVPGLVVSDFGVASVVSGGAGIYNVTLNYLDPYTGTATLNNLVVTATLTNGYCGFISVTVPAGPGNTFVVETKDPMCNHTDMSFMFHVTGRP